ncbi:MAG: N-acetyltransferase [Alphaproteobacteria bacterium]|nr:N-acetyltransferase [Alphaproteobacteria bacterium]
MVERIGDIDAAVWDRCAGAENPFLSHAFLNALEVSGSATARTGWLPQHLIAEDGEGRVLGAVPMYLKSHSYGEYVFDHGWADAYRRAGGQYYPKLQVAVPFTPVPGPRLLLAPDAGQDVADMLIAGLVEVADRRDVSSVHITFAREAEWRRLGEAGFLQRQGFQFHWSNQGYETFDDFLAALSSRKRKAIRKERREAVAGGLTIRRVTGADIEERHWDAFFRFYMSTSDRKWGQAYLNRAFFHEIAKTLADRVMLVMVERDGKLIAGALNLIGADALYGRNWGCIERHPFLHFEACYYQAIEFAIERKLARVEAGAQGEHKLQRGYLPTATYSAHWIRDPSLRRAIADYLQRERSYIRDQIEGLSAEGPFKHEMAYEPPPDSPEAQ